MKKSTKILSLLMALVMIFSLTTVALADDNSVSLGTTAYGDATLKKEPHNEASLRKTYNNGTDNKKVGETGGFHNIPIATYSNTYLSPVWYAVSDDSVKVTGDEGTIGNFEFSLISNPNTSSYFRDWPALNFSYTALKAGSVTVTVTYYYNYHLSNTAGYIIDYTWYKDTVTFKVNVSEGEVTPPAQPTENDLKSFREPVNKPHIDNRKAAVYMWCSNFDHSYFFDYVTDVADGYALGEVVPNDGSKTNFPVSVYPWMCVMTLDADKYMAAYNASEETSQHYLVNPGSTETVKWFWNASSGWKYAYSGPVYFDITHTDPNPVETKYTVTYTDGVNGAAFADQTYTVKEGDATPAFQGTPERESYVFLGWEPEVAETVTANATYVAKWEEKLESVTVTASRREGELLFLNDVLKVTAKANTNAYVTISPTLNGAFRQIDSKRDGDSLTIWYRVKKVVGTYTKLSFTATATKGTQTPVTSDELTFGVNLRNRIHVTLAKPDGTIIDNATMKLVNNWAPNTSWALKYDAAKKEYVMNNAWDLSNQDAHWVEINVNGETYIADKTVDNENLLDVVHAGEKEIYVKYTVVDPIKVTVNVDGKLFKEQSFKGSMSETLNYAPLINEAMAASASNDTYATVESITGLTEDGKAEFGVCTNVVINIKLVKLTGISTVSGN